MVAQRSFPLTLQAHSFEWREYGFMLHVPEGSLPPEMTQTTVDVRVSLSGQFEFPEDSDVVSATYWLSCPHKFMKPLDVEFQHCAAITDPSQRSQLSFVISKSTQGSLCKFKVLEGGTFSQHSSYGRISLTDFSRLAIVKRTRRRIIDRIFSPSHRIQLHFSGHTIVKKTRRKRLRTRPRKVQPAQHPNHQDLQLAIDGDHSLHQVVYSAAGASHEEEPKEQYCAQLYKIQEGNHWQMHLVITKDLEAYLTVQFLYFICSIVTRSLLCRLCSRCMQQSASHSGLGLRMTRSLWVPPRNVLVYTMDGISLHFLNPQ